jgi:hypothetical protein
MYFDMYPKGVTYTFGIHLGYIKLHVSCARFLGVTLDTYQDTSGYVYPGLFITIHHDLHRDTKSRYMYLHDKTQKPQNL